MAAGVLRGAGKRQLVLCATWSASTSLASPMTTSVFLMFAGDRDILGKTKPAQSPEPFKAHSEKPHHLSSHHGVGLWTGLVIGVSLQAIVFVVVLCKFDWKKASEEVCKQICLS